MINSYKDIYKIKVFEILIKKCSLNYLELSKNKKNIQIIHIIRHQEKFKKTVIKAHIK